MNLNCNVMTALLARGCIVVSVTPLNTLFFLHIFLPFPSIHPFPHLDDLLESPVNG